MNTVTVFSPIEGRTQTSDQGRWFMGLTLSEEDAAEIIDTIRGEIELPYIMRASRALPTIPVHDLWLCHWTGQEPPPSLIPGGRDQVEASHSESHHALNADMGNTVSLNSIFQNDSGGARGWRYPPIRAIADNTFGDGPVRGRLNPPQMIIACLWTMDHESRRDTLKALGRRTGRALLGISQELAALPDQFSQGIMEDMADPEIMARLLSSPNRALRAEVMEEVVPRARRTPQGARGSTPTR